MNRKPILRIRHILLVIRLLMSLALMAWAIHTYAALIDPSLTPFAILFGCHLALDLLTLLLAIRDHRVGDDIGCFSPKGVWRIVKEHELVSLAAAARFMITVRLVIRLMVKRNLVEFATAGLVLFIWDVIELAIVIHTRRQARKAAEEAEREIRREELRKKYAKENQQ